MFKRIAITLSMAAVLLAACAPQAEVLPTQAPPTPAVPTAVPPTATGQPEATATPIRVDLTPAQRAAVQALMDQLNITADKVTLLSTEAVEWPNGCMGVVHMGVMCTQNVVPGFKVVLSVSAQTYEYHTNQDGTAVVYAEPGAPFLKFVVESPDHTLQIIDSQIAGGHDGGPAETGFLPMGGAAGAGAYGLSVTDKASAVAVDPKGSTPLPFVKTNYGLAVFPGGAGSGPLLAWGTDLSADNQQTQLFTAQPDGTGLAPLLTDTITPPQAYQLVAQRWTADGSALYFSREPYGLGGYILFNGASSLYKITTADKQVTEIVPLDFKSPHFICLDALSLDGRWVADHCDPKVISVRDLSNGAVTSIQAPAEVTDYALLGSARFNSDATRVAFALARGNPEGEQGWVAVSDSLSGASHLVATSQAGQYFTVAAWLNNSTLLLQSNTLNCNPVCASALWTVGVDGSNLTKVADGTFVAIIGAAQN